MECIDSADMSIRLRALDLVVGMVSTDNLMSIVGRLMRQLRSSSSAPGDPMNGIPQTAHPTIEPLAESDDESPEVDITAHNDARSVVPLPDDYKIDVISRILDMCSRNNYANLVDFDWYIDILTQLLRNSPVSVSRLGKSAGPDGWNVADRIGDELRNVAVKVKALRANAVKAGESIIIASHSGALTTGKGALRSISWIAGEYSIYLESPEDVMTALLSISQSSTSAEASSYYLQSVMKVFARIAGDDRLDWTLERKTMMTLLMARIIHALEPMSTHPDLEVQERAVEFSELLKLAAEASSAQHPTSNSSHNDAPLLLTQAIPSLFTGLELNSVAATAQRNVPLPDGLDLDQPINIRLNELLASTNLVEIEETGVDECEIYYHQPIQAAIPTNGPAAARLAASNEEHVASYQQDGEDSYLDPDIVARRRAERVEKNKDDPFYIAGNTHASGTSTPLHHILQHDNGTNLDIDSIPIMQLDLGKSLRTAAKPRQPVSSQSRQRIQIAADETLVGSGTSSPRNDDSEASGEGSRARPSKHKQSLLFVDSSNLGSLSLENDPVNGNSAFDYDRQQREEAEMAKAMQEVERLRLEMQRANERIQAAHGVSLEGTVVKKKKKKARVAGGEDMDGVKREKKVKTKATMSTSPTASVENFEPVTIVKKKKKKKVRNIDNGEPVASATDTNATTADP